MKYDTRCKECGHEFEDTRHWSAPVGQCPICGGESSVVWKSVPILDKAKDPYDLLDGPIPDSKPIKSFASDKRRGGKDTT